MVFGMKTLNSRRAVDDHERVLKALLEMKPQQVCDLMLKHVLQIQGGLKRVKSQTQ